MGRLNNRVIIISGATSGMGKAIAETFASEGAQLVLNGRHEDKGIALLRELDSFRDRVAWQCGDVGLLETNEKLVNLALDRYGKLDTIVCNAGVLGLGSVVELPVEDWKATLDTNLSALFYLSRCAIPHMQKNDLGVVLANASIAAFKAFPKHPAYCASKAGQVALTRQIALEYGPTIRANVMCPGPVDTPLIWNSAKAFENGEAAVEDARKATAMNRLGQPRDISELALFLVSEESSWITGSAITIDGGVSIS